MIDGLAYAGPEHLDAAFVAVFDRKQGYPDPAEDLDALASQGLDASSAVVHLGAGAGQFALAAARRFGRVTAVDVSPAMLAVAGFEIVTAQFDGRLYGAYTCVKS
jgi:methylase of polypeptide subunit release factors